MTGLLFLTQRIPYPPIKGEKIRPLQILKHLGRSFDVYLGCLIDQPSDWEHVDAVRAFCKEAYFAPLDRRTATLRYFGALRAGDALSVRFFCDRGLAQWVGRVLEQVRPEVAFVNSSNMAPYILGLPRTKLRV